MLPDTNTASRSAYSRDEFCRAFGISLPTLHREIKAGRIRVFKCGRRTLIAASELEAWPARLSGGAGGCAA
jgi:excisionase family DNA binding protein